MIILNKLHKEFKKCLFLGLSWRVELEAVDCFKSLETLLLQTQTVSRLNQLAQLQDIPVLSKIKQLTTWQRCPYCPNPAFQTGSSRVAFAGQAPVCRSATLCSSSFPGSTSGRSASGSTQAS